MLGNEEDFTAALGFKVEGLDPDLSALDPANFGRMMAEVTSAYPNLAMVVTTLDETCVRPADVLAGLPDARSTEPPSERP